METAKKRIGTRKIVMLGIFSAIAYVVMVVGRIPMVMFLKYDPKDVVITIAGFLYGPLSAFLVSAVVSLVEMVTVSETGPIGLIMNVLSTVAFACTAAALYKKKRTINGAVAGLIAGSLLMTAVMLLWNYLITPLYMGVSREDVAGMLVPVFLPFNLVKAGLNATLSILLYKPLVRALRSSGALQPREEDPMAAAGSRSRWGVMLVAGVVLITCILAVLVFQGII